MAPRHERLMQVKAVDKAEIEEFLFHEADLLDDRSLEEWLKLFHKDGIYWLPIEPNADPLRDPSVLYDDERMRTARVNQLIKTNSHWCQIPPSRTVHSISNVRVSAPQPDGSVEVKCNLVITEIRSAGPRTIQYGLNTQRTIAARCLYRLVKDADRWLIALKKVMLVNRDQPLENLTFLI
jgi:3-phenylpropionate/cinnamic acid dioxygenase small subunit